MKMPSPSLFLRRIRTQTLHTEVALPRTRLILYSISFLTSLLSTFFYSVTFVHHARTLGKDPTYRTNYYYLTSVMIVPLLWSVVWSLIASRSLLKAINHEHSSEATRASVPADTEALSSPVHSTNSPKNQTRPASDRPHPVLALVIELFLWPTLVNIGFWFGFAPSKVAHRHHRHHRRHSMYNSCPRYAGKNRDQLMYYCKSAYGEVQSLETTAFFLSALNVLAHLMLFIVACIVVHRWRGKTGRRRSGRGHGNEERRKRRSHASIDGVDGGRWIELGRGRDGKQ